MLLAIACIMAITVITFSDNRLRYTMELLQWCPEMVFLVRLLPTRDVTHLVLVVGKSRRPEHLFPLS